MDNILEVILVTVDWVSIIKVFVLFGHCAAMWSNSLTLKTSILLNRSRWFTVNSSAFIIMLLSRVTRSKMGRRLRLTRLGLDRSALIGIIHIVCASKKEKPWEQSKSWTSWLACSRVETSYTKSSRLKFFLSPERNLDKTTVLDAFSPHLTRNSSNLVMYSVTSWLPRVNWCHWSSKRCLYDTSKYFSWSFNLISSPVWTSSCLLKVISFSILAQCCLAWPTNFILANQIPIIRHIIPIKIMIHARCPIEKILGIQLTIKDGCV